MNFSGLRLAGVVVRVVPVLVVLAVVLGSMGVIESGNVGVRKTLGSVSMEELEPGLYIKWPLISQVDELTAKEVEVPLINMTPKAKDNLSLRDMDVSIYYKADASLAADMLVQFSGQTVYPERIFKREDGSDVLVEYTEVRAPAYLLVRGIAREAVYNAVADEESLSVHLNREKLAERIKETLQTRLSDAAKGLTVTRVVIRQTMTDPSIEQSIHEAVANQKRLEAKKVQVEIAEKDAEIEITRAKGLAEAQRIISGTLTREYLTHQRNEALKIAAEKGTLTTLVVPEGSAPLLSIK